MDIHLMCFFPRIGPRKQGGQPSALTHEAAREGRPGAGCKRRTKVAASWFQQPPTSTPRTTRWQRPPRTSSGYVRSLARRAARAAPGRPRGRAAAASGKTRVVSTAIAPLAMFDRWDLMKLP